MLNFKSQFLPSLVALCSFRYFPSLEALAACALRARAVRAAGGSMLPAGRGTDLTLGRSKVGCVTPAAPCHVAPACSTKVGGSDPAC